MLTKNDCWMQDRCKVFKENNCTEEYCMQMLKMDDLFTKTLLTADQRKHVTFRLDKSRIDEEAYKYLSELEKHITEFVNEGGNLYIYSSVCGNGKTAWATRLIQEYLYKNFYRLNVSDPHALFIHVPRFLLSMKDNISQSNEYFNYIKNNLLTTELVVWDEIGVKGITDFENDNLLYFINARLDAGKSNIYTFNMTPEELRIKIGDRLYSRIINSSYPIEFKGMDKRGSDF